MAKCHKLTPFKTIVFTLELTHSRPSQWLIRQNVTNWLLSRPLHFAPNLDSFQDHHILDPIDSFQDPMQWTIQNITQLTHFKTLIVVYYSVSISMGDYLQNLHGRLPPSIFLQNTLHSEFWTLFMKQRRKMHHMQVINTFQHPGATHSTSDTAIFIKINSFQDPRNFTSTIHSNIRLKTLSHLTLTQDKDTITVHIANLYIHISHFKLLKSTLHVP